MSTLSEFLNDRLRIEDAKVFDAADSPLWWDDSVTVEIDGETYLQYLEVLPPRFMRGSLFTFGEGSGNFTLFWQQDRRHFAHQLSLADTETFCLLSGTRLQQ